MNEPFDQLTRDIISYAGLSSQEATGFHALHCPICKKMDKKTGGFKFEHDKIIYNCFRGSCDASIVYEVDGYIPRKFKNLMQAIGVTIPISLRMQKHSTATTTKKIIDRDIYTEHSYAQQQLQDGWIPILDSDHRRKQYWLDYFESRCCSVADVFMIEDGKYKGCSAIAMYYFDKLIGFQVVTDGEKAKYINESTNSHLVYLPERKPDKVMIVCEGAIDAKCFPSTAAVLSSRISNEQAYILRDSELWFLPDRGSNKFIDDFHRYPNAKMIIPTWSYKDLNQAVCELGVIEVAERIRESLVADKRVAKTKYELWSKKQR